MLNTHGSLRLCASSGTDLFPGQDEPWVIFSNAKFVGRPDAGLRYYDAGKDQKNITIFDQYTGVGEVLAVHALDHLFGEFHREIRVKRGSLFSLDDAKNNNLIFVGSPLENLTLLEIPGTEEFVFHRVPSGPRKGDPEIMNVHPQSGEPKELLGTPGDDPLTEDYAVIAMVKGLEPNQSVLILAGETTIGTQAAVEYVCNKNSVEQLLLRLSVAQTGQLKPFEAVIRVKVTRGRAGIDGTGCSASDKLVLCLAALPGVSANVQLQASVQRLVRTSGPIRRRVEIPSWLRLSRLFVVTPIPIDSEPARNSASR